METSARVVVIGAGVVGCAVADHLTSLGWREVVVLDQGPLFETGGSTSHAPGLMFQTNPSKTMTDLAKYSVARYLELELDGEPCGYRVGGLEVAETPDRWKDLKRRHGLATSWGLESHLISPDECAEKIPLLDPDKIRGGFFVPSDGIAKGVRACEAMARLATGRGARFHGETEVTGIEVKNGRVRAVETGGGRIETELVVSCAGMWGPRIGRMVGMQVPLVPMQHQFAWTAPLAELAGETREVVHPMLRHQDFSMYFRHREDHYGIGTYRHRPMPVKPDDIGRNYRGEGELPSVWEFTPEDFEPSWREARRMLPPLRNAEIERPMNGLFSFTPDGGSLLGESREVRGFWIAEAVWVTHALGVGRAMAEWIVSGVPSIDLAGADVHRFEPYSSSPEYILARSAQSFREVYDIIHPEQPMEEPRPLRASPFYPRQIELGAYFLEASGWERPHWYESNEPLLSRRDIPDRSEWAGRYWSPIAGAEHQATRERVALFDMTSLKKAEVTGPGALDFLQGLTTGQLDKPAGKVTYALMLDAAAGIKSDITVARLGEEHFQVGLNGSRDIEWLERHSEDGSVQVRDITSGTCCVGVWGPAARDLVQSLSEDDFSNEAFGFFNARQAHLREVPVTALRLSYVGELGWEIYTTADLGLRLWDLLWRAGRPYGVLAGGRAAFNSMRVEKGYRAWGTDMTTEHDPYEAGLDFAVKLEAGDFVGKEALLRRKQEGPRRKLVCAVLDDPGVVVMGKEPVFGDGRAVGYVTSAAYGYSVGQSIAYAWVPPELAGVGNRLEIEYFGERHPATVTEEPLFDPAMKRMRA